jgi:integrase
MAPKLSASSIRDYMNIVKGVVASAINENGEELFPRKWNDECIDAPVIDAQNQPSTNGESMTAILAVAKGRYQMLFALLAGCGPMRAGEALGLEIGKHISPDSELSTFNEIQPYFKTKNGSREVDLCVDLAETLKAYVGIRTSGLLFHTSSGAQVLQTNVLRDSLHPTLKKLKHVKGGFNIFRRYRLTLLGKSDCPDVLNHSWSGHAPKHVSERYERLHGEREYRLEWAERIGLGFKILGSVGLPTSGGGKRRVTC